MRNNSLSNSIISIDSSIDDMMKNKNKILRIDKTKTLKIEKRKINKNR